MSMSSRERVLAAINHQEPDRVPIDLGGESNTGIAAAIYVSTPACESDWGSKVSP